jgi:hypothetical protein
MLVKITYIKGSLQAGLQNNGPETITPEQASALTANPIDIYDNSDALILLCEGYNIMKECRLFYLRQPLPNLRSLRCKQN